MKAYQLPEAKEAKRTYDHNRRKAMTQEDIQRDNDLHTQARDRNRDHYRDYQKEWRKRNLGKAAATMRKYRAKNPNVDMAHTIRSRINSALKSIYESRRIVELLGCSVSEFKKYIESLFEPGMAWDNYGLMTWHLHHVQPCSSFDMLDPKEQEKCFHFSNVKPLWAQAHMRGEG